MASHSSIAWRIPWAEEPGGLQSMGLQLDPTERLSTDRQNSPGGLVVTSLPVNVGDMGSIFGLGRFYMPRHGATKPVIHNY